MRKLLLMFLGAVLVYTASAQDVRPQQGVRLEKTYSVDANAQMMSKSVYEYDANGRQTLQYDYAYTDGVLVNTVKTVFNYDDQGRLVKSEGYESDGGDFTLTGYSENSEFDAENRATVVTEYELDEANPTAGLQKKSKTVIKKFNGLAAEDWELYTWTGSDWALNITSHSDFNDQGLPTQTTATMSVMGMMMTNTVKMEYDEHWQVVKSESSSGYGLVTTQEYKNSYDADGNLVVQTASTMGVEVTMYLFWQKGGSTGIGRVLATDAPNAYYDLGGRRLNGIPASKGIFIRNGKKVLIK